MSDEKLLQRLKEAKERNAGIANEIMRRDNLMKDIEAEEEKRSNELLLKLAKIKEEL